MTCRQVQNKISRCIDSRMTAVESAKIEEHLGSCADCAREGERIRQVDAAMMLLERKEPRVGGWERLRSQIEKAPEKRRWSAGWRWNSVAVGAGAFACVVAVIVVFVPARVDRTATSILVGPPTVGIAKPVRNVPTHTATAVITNGASHLPHDGSITSVKVISASDHRRVASAGNVKRYRGTWQKPIVRVTAASPGGLNTAEPDPEFSRAQDADAPSVAEEVAETVSLGMQPLVVAAQSSDPVGWLTDVNTEDWL